MRPGLGVGAITLAAASLMAGATAQAASYPAQQIRMVVGFGAGGPTDVIARAIAQDMSVSLGQPVVVENKPGASGNIATDVVAMAAPDGYTLLFTAQTHLVNKLLMRDSRFDPLKDFTPISLVSTLPMLLVTQRESPYQTAMDIVAAAKQRPDQVSYASAGIGSSGHLAGALFATLSDTEMLHVPFRGNSYAITEVLAGRISFIFYPMIGVSDMVASKQVKVLAAGTEHRLPDFPTVPTMAEAGFPAFTDTIPWLGIMGPAGMPADVVARLEQAIHASLAKPDTLARLRSLGAITTTNTSGEFREFLAQDLKRWEKLVKSAGVTSSF